MTVVDHEDGTAVLTCDSRERRVIQLSLELYAKHATQCLAAGTLDAACGAQLGELVRAYSDRARCMADELRIELELPPKPTPWMDALAERARVSGCTPEVVLAALAILAAAALMCDLARSAVAARAHGSFDVDLQPRTRPAEAADSNGRPSR